MIKNGWFCCPYCGKKLFVVDDNAHASGCHIKCNGIFQDKTRCNNIIEICF